MERCPHFTGLFDQPRQLQNLLGLQHRPFDAQDGERRGNIRNGIKSQTDRRASRCRLRLPRRALIGDGFGYVRQRAFQRRAISLRRQLFQFGSPQRAAHVASHQLAERREFQ